MIEIQHHIESAIAAGKDVWVAGPAIEQHIAMLEAALDVQLPLGYQAFLQKFGALSIGDKFVSGIIDGSPLTLDGGSMYGETQRSRHEQSLPPGLLVLQPDGDAPYCLAAPHDEVICYQVSTQTSKQVASSFEDWLRRFVFT